MFIPDEFISPIESVLDVASDKRQPAFYVASEDVYVARKEDSWHSYTTNEGQWEGWSYRTFIRLDGEACRNVTTRHPIFVEPLGQDQWRITLRKKDLSLMVVEESALVGLDDVLLEMDEMRIGNFTTKNEEQVGRHHRP